MNPVISPLLLLNLASSSSFGMPAIVVISLLSILVLYFLGRIFVNELKKRYDAYEEHEQIIKAQNDQIYRLQTENKIRNEFKDELQESYKLAGMSKGYQEATAMLPGFYNNLISLNKQLYDEHKTYIIKSVEGSSQVKMLNDARATDQDKIKDLALDKRTLRENQHSLHDKIANLEKARNRDQDEIERLRRLVEASQKASQPSRNASLKPSQASQEASRIIPLSEENASQRLPGKEFQPLSESKTRNFRPYTEDHIFEYQENEVFELRERVFANGGWTGHIDVYRKIDNVKVGQFMPRDLERGKTKFINEVVKYVVLCGMPDCDIVKITNQPATKCCCKSHANRYNELKKGSVKIGS